jgi:hypothetical protein
VCFLNTVALIFFTGGYNGDIDLPFYKSEYINHFISKSPADKVYEIMSIFFSSIGMPFEVYHFFLSTVSIVLIVHVITRLSNRPAFCTALLWGFSTIEYAWQLRSLVASALIIFAVYVLFVKPKNIWRNFTYIFLIFIAFGFHFFSIVFLLLLFVERISLKPLKWIVCVMAIVGSLIVVPFVRFMSGYIPDLQNYTNELSIKTFVISCLWQISGVILCERMVHSCEEDDIQNSQCTLFLANTELNEAILKGVVLFLILVPFYWVTALVSRFMRVWFVFYIIIASNTIGSIERGRIYVLKFPYIYKEVFMLYNTVSFFAFYIWFSKTTNILKSYLSNTIF